MEAKNTSVVLRSMCWVAGFHEVASDLTGWNGLRSQSCAPVSLSCMVGNQVRVKVFLRCWIPASSFYTMQNTWRSVTRKESGLYTIHVSPIDAFLFCKTQYKWYLFLEDFLDQCDRSNHSYLCNCTHYLNTSFHLIYIITYAHHILYSCYTVRQFDSFFPFWTRTNSIL